MSDADRVARERAQAKQEAVGERAAHERQEDEIHRSALLGEIDKLIAPVLSAQKAADYPALETLQLSGPGDGQRGGFEVATSWIADRGSATVAVDYLLGDGTFATRYDSRQPTLTGNWKLVSVTRLAAIRDGLQRLSTPSP